MRHKLLLFLLLAMPFCQLKAQAPAASLKPGFDAPEYDALLMVMNAVMDSTPNLRISGGGHLHIRAYRSPEVGLLNRWELYKRNDGVAIIHLRGTVNKPTSWLANFYAAMVPAKGKLVLAPGDTFKYQLASRKEASVHVGWLLSLAHLVKDMTPVLRQEVASGTRQFIIAGHSQGAALAALLRAYVQYQPLLGEGAQVKTYMSAAPKPGDVFFSTELDAYTRDGWAFRVINAYDWVPQTPFTEQAIADFNALNPFKNASQAINKGDFWTRLYLNVAYRSIHNRTDAAADVFRNYLGNDVFLLVKKALPTFQKPVYSKSNNYYPAGTPVTLMPDEEYFKRYPDTSRNVFTHHMPLPYQYLLRKAYGMRQP